MLQVMGRGGVRKMKLRLYVRPNGLYKRQETEIRTGKTGCRSMEGVGAIIAPVSFPFTLPFH